MNQVLDKYLMEEAKIIFAQINPEGNILVSNRFFKQWVGEENPSHISSLIPEMYDSETILERFRDDKQVMITVNSSSGNPQTFLFRFIKKKYDLLIFGEYNVEEITNLQNELIEMNSELSSMTRQLFKQNAELSKLNEVKERFVSIAAHDLRNPLGNIISIGTLLEQELQDKLTEEQANFLKAIQNLGESGLQLLNDLLDHASLSQGKLKLNPEKTDPVSLIRDNMESNRFFADKRNIKIIYNGPSSTLPLYTDKAAFQQILNNLLSNAIKFSPDGQTVEIGLQTGENHHTFSVSDQGPGISDEDLPKLYEAFETTSSVPHGKEKSTGLGLWIVKKLIENLSGELSVESRIGKGTTFTFCLPVYKNQNK